LLTSLKRPPSSRSSRRVTQAPGREDDKGGRAAAICARELVLLFRFVGHLPGADTSASSYHRPRAGVPQSSGEETAASAEVVIAAYDAMAIRCRKPLLVSIALVADRLLEVGQVVPA